MRSYLTSARGPGRLLVAWLLCFGSLTTGCSAPRIDNTRLASVDLVAMTDQMAASLLSDAAIAERGPGSEPWVVTLDRVTNLTNDILPQREQWAFMARLRAQLSQSPALRQRNIHFVLPPDWAEALNRRVEEPPVRRTTPTHALTATFYALTTRTRTGRSDSYVCAFQLIGLASGQIVWEDRYEVKRATVRSEFD